MTRPRIDRVLRAWALASFVAWIMLLAIAIGATSNVQAQPAVADTFVAPDGDPANEFDLEHRRDDPQTSVDAVAARVKCPTCDSTLDESDSEAAERMRAWIAEAVTAGWTEDEIYDGLVDEYGGDESILAIPRSDGLSLGAWLAPVVIILAMVIVGVLVPRRWRRDRRNVDQTTLDSSSSS